MFLSFWVLAKQLRAWMKLYAAELVVGFISDRNDIVTDPLSYQDQSVGT